MSCPGRAISVQSIRQSSFHLVECLWSHFSCLHWNVDCPSCNICPLVPIYWSIYTVCKYILIFCPIHDIQSYHSELAPYWFIPTLSSVCMWKLSWHLFVWSCGHLLFFYDTCDGKDAGGFDVFSIKTLCKMLLALKESRFSIYQCPV